MEILSSYSIFNFANEFNGGALSTLSFTAVGISSYITSSIIIQLLSAGIKSLEDISKMPGGEKLIKKATIILGIILSFISSIGLVKAISTQTELLTNTSWYVFVIIAICHCIGTAISIWIGETITNKGFGNGVSLLIALNIATSIPNNISTIISNYQTNAVIIIGAITFIVLFLVVVMETSEIHIPVNYAKNISTYKRNQNYLPIKINIAGVMPMIFATTIFQLIATAIELFKWDMPELVQKIITYGSVPYIITSIIIVYAFTFFYTSLIFKEDDIAKSLQSYEGVIDNIRQGTETENYLKRVSKRICIIGATGMSLIMLVPMICFNLIEYQGIQPTSLIILSGVSLEIIQKIKVEYLSQKCTCDKKSALISLVKEKKNPKNTEKMEVII